MRIVQRPAATRAANARFYREMRNHSHKRAREIWRIFRDADYKLLAKLDKSLSSPSP